MSTSVIYPNGQQLTTSARTIAAMNTLIQDLTCGALGIVPSDYSKVRVDWQKRGQPSQSVDADICYLSCTPEPNPYSLIRDQKISGNVGPLLQTWEYTQVWSLHWVFYGPNSTTRAKLLHSATFLDWFNEQMNNASLFPEPDAALPTRVPEVENAQWWERADFQLTVYESVVETLSNVGMVTSVEVIVQDSDGVVADITIT